MTNAVNVPHRPSLILALIPVLVLIGLLGINVLFYGDGATGGPNQIALVLAAAVAATIGGFLRVPFRESLQGIATSLSSAIGAILILLLIGSLAGTWMLSGVVPVMVVEMQELVQRDGAFLV